MLKTTDSPDQTVEHPKDDLRRGANPRVFQGTIASANELLKRPEKRDELRDRFGACALEMEASGEYLFTDGIDDLTVVAIDANRDGNFSEDEFLINDNAWTNLARDANNAGFTTNGGQYIPLTIDVPEDGNCDDPVNAADTASRSLRQKVVEPMPVSSTGMRMPTLSFPRNRVRARLLPRKIFQSWPFLKIICEHPVA